MELNLKPTPINTVGCGKNQKDVVFKKISEKIKNIDKKIQDDNLLPLC